MTGFEIPQSWTLSTLGAVAKWGSGGTPSRSNPNLYGGSIPWFKTGELGPRVIFKSEETISSEALTQSSAKLFPPGSIALAMYGATIGKVSFLGIEAATNQACAVGIPNQEVACAGYIYYFLRSQKDAFIASGQGGAQPNISQTVVKAWPIPIAPFAEQKRIAEKLDTVLSRVDTVNPRLAHVTPLLKRFRQSVLAAATSGRLTEDWRGTTSNDATVSVDRIEDAGIWAFKAIPSSWMLQSFADCFTDSTDSARKVPQAEYETKGEIPVVDQGEKLIGGFVNDSSKQSAARLPAIVFGDHTRCIKWIDFHFVQGADGVKVLSPKLGNDRYGWVLLKALELPDKVYSIHFKY